ncbi:MAG: hypothetical protein HRF50_01000 [Phycisphaerae bacterium]|jgi:hypothetical protein
MTVRKYRPTSRRGEATSIPAATPLTAYTGRRPGGILKFVAASMAALLGGCLAPRPAAVNVWAESDTREITPGSRPSPENDLFSAARGEVSLVAAINETVAFQLGLQTDAPPSGALEIEVSDLTGPAGTLHAAEAVSMHRMRPVLVREFRSWYPRHTGRSAEPTSVLDLLVPWGAPRGGGPISLGDRQAEVVWIDIDVPPTTAAGTYAGTITVRSASDPKALARRVALKLTVLPVAIPSERSLPLVCAIDPRALLEEHAGWRSTATAEETRILPDEPSHQAAASVLNQVVTLFHEHRATPAPIVSFPKYRLTSEQTVEAEWAPYDALFGGWYDGSALPDRVPLAVALVPLSERYPSAELNGGFESAGYARTLAAYVAECRQHFEARGWLGRAVVRPSASAALGESSVRRAERFASILAQGESGLPFLTHLAPGTLRSLGWHGAPVVELAHVGVWASPAAWCEPGALAQQRNLGSRTWFMADQPPYSGSLRPEAPPTDARVLAWLAYRYGLNGVWIEGALTSEAGIDPQQSDAAPLAYSGRPFGLAGAVLPSVRLKRLRRGLFDYELLHLLEIRGKPLLAQRTAQQVVRRALADACGENLLSTLDCGWSQDPYVYELARKVLLQELANQFAPTDAGLERQIDYLTDWGRVMSLSAVSRAEVRGVRLEYAEDSLRAHVSAALLNNSEQAISGVWKLPDPPLGWEQRGDAPLSVAAHQRGVTEIEVTAGALAYNAEGIYPFRMMCETPAAGSFAAEGRLAVASCPKVSTPPRIDGDLSDWVRAANNSAGDFLLCAGAGDPPGSRRPVRSTRAYFCADSENLYVGIWCELGGDVRPIWTPDNLVPIDGAHPWGQDVVELIISPQNELHGDGGRLLVLQIKPNAVFSARRGALTIPPMNASEDWPTRPRIAVDLGAEAWTVEVAVPIASLGEEAARSVVLGCNVTRLDARRGEYSSWSGASGYIYSPAQLGNLIRPAP